MICCTISQIRQIFNASTHPFFRTVAYKWQCEAIIHEKMVRYSYKAVIRKVLYIVLEDIG
ncbi:MAG: hypothetical protein DRO87_06920 [Candidatus Thorarchaeota archaeon]|nr:MAG: hypothetical protein DRO87_06920 [Candidatus Thorarchaeota archaeon]